ncbi:hypothetical protein BHM03_00006625 [Ensete ventricosum]|nr:hypothetical protein BHM03_00006625 [Ensete ventricosum]
MRGCGSFFSAFPSPKSYAFNLLTFKFDDLLCVISCLRDCFRVTQLFTNSDRQHARRTLQRLGVEEDCFHRIICFETMNPHLFKDARAARSSRALPTTRNPEVILKPSAAAMKMAVWLAGFAPHRTLFVDDNERNIAAGKAIGLRTALVIPSPSPSPAFLGDSHIKQSHVLFLQVGKRERTKEDDYLLDSISELREVIPEIWGEPEKKGGGEQGAATTMRRDLDSIRETTPIGA